MGYTHSTHTHPHQDIFNHKISCWSSKRWRNCSNIMKTRRWNCDFLCSRDAFCFYCITVTFDTQRSRPPPSRTKHDVSRQARPQDCPPLFAAGWPLTGVQTVLEASRDQQTHKHTQTRLGNTAGHLNTNTHMHTHTVMWQQRVFLGQEASVTSGLFLEHSNKQDTEAETQLHCQSNFNTSSCKQRSSTDCLSLQLQRSEICSKMTNSAPSL